MGSGKTTLGKQIAQKLSFHFIDLDNFIEVQENQTIHQLFIQLGHELFRQKEQEALIKVITSAPTPLILACGGGTPCYLNNLSIMQQSGYLIYLKAEPQTLANRIRLQQKQRPLLSNVTQSQLLNYISQMLQSREPYYWQADFVFTIEKDDPLVLTEFIQICSRN
ncbi:MAG: shikimate kinase [Bacteroidia bacterium]|nr:shikimate kinase [Bacteroidia bacterium]MDW8159277.1 shikimate kinase [Bacteroidia bacterium]